MRRNRSIPIISSIRSRSTARSGYKLEAPPLHPILTATTLPDDGVRHAQWMREFRNMQVLIALLRDGFNPESVGGTVRLRDDGTPVLDYPLGAFLWEGVRRAFLSMAEIQFAAGATRVSPLHANGDDVHEPCAGPQRRSRRSICGRS